MDSTDGNGRRDRWARLRFAVVGPLLASPPPAGRLRAAIQVRTRPTVSSRGETPRRSRATNEGSPAASSPST